MNRTFKRLTAGLLVAIMLFGASPIAAFTVFDNTPWTGIEANAKDNAGICGDGLTWTFDESLGELTISGKGDMYDWNKYSEAPWYSIEKPIKSVKVCNGVTSIGDCAFDNTDIEKYMYLESLTLADTVTKIGSASFFCCGNLKKVRLSSSLKTIGMFAFAFCIAYSDVDLPDSLQTISEFAFAYSEERGKITIPSSVTEIGEFAFILNEGLKGFEVAADNKNYSTDENGVLFDKSKTTLVQFPSASDLTSYEIPSTVTQIGSAAFYGCHNLTELSVPDTVLSIGADVFTDSGIQFEEYNGALYLDNYLIKGPAASECYVREGTVMIVGGAFAENTELVNVYFPDSLKIIESGAFKGCTNLTYMLLSESVETIGYGAFLSCESLTGVVIPEGVKKIGEGAFADCTSVVGFNVDADNKFYLVDEFGVLYSKDKTQLLQYPAGNKRTSFSVPDSVTEIGANAFCGSVYLTELQLSESLTKIGEGAFKDCENLKTASYSGTHSDWKDIETGEENSFLTKALVLDCDSDSSYYLPYKCGDDSIATLYLDGRFIVSGSGEMYDWYTNTSPWYSRRKEIASVSVNGQITRIGWDSFISCDNLTSVTLCDSVKYIGGNSFEDCKKLKDLDMGNGITEIGTAAFKNCDSLTNVAIPDSVTHIRSEAFYDCDGIQGVEVGDSVTEIESEAFYDCDSIKEFNIPDSVTHIGDKAFSSCGMLADITLPCSLTFLGTRAFNDCNKITEITIPGSVSVFRSEVFYSCDGLKKAVIASPIDTIPEGTFNNCSNLTTVVLPSTLKTIETRAFGFAPSLDTVYFYGTESDWKKVSIGLLNGNLSSIFSQPETVFVEVVEGMCKENLAWTFDTRTCELIISGNGEMRDWEDTKTVPWAIFISLIQKITVSEGVAGIGANAFNRCVNLKEVSIPVSVLSIGKGAFEGGTKLTDVYYDGTEAEWRMITLAAGNEDVQNAQKHFRTDDTCVVYYNANGGTGAPDKQIKNREADMVLGNVIPVKTYTVAFDGNGGTVSPTSKKLSCTFKEWNTKTDGTGEAYLPGDTYTGDSVTLYAQWENPTVGELPLPKRIDYVFVGWYTAMPNGQKITPETVITDDMTFYAQWVTPKIDEYNMGEESYKFGNYMSILSPFGNCFGMSVTSSAYHLGLLDISMLGIGEGNDLYSINLTLKTAVPIAYYQKAQGEYFRNAIVAGGIWEKNRIYDADFDWQEVVDCVDGHEYDRKGELMITMRNEEGGHAVNFLRYAVVDGQERIYIYDNNFPDTETYLYMDKGGIYQAPKATFRNPVKCISAADISMYFELVKDYNPLRAIYADADKVKVEGVEGYPMFGVLGMSNYMMYEVKEDVKEIKIIPLEDDVEFEYNEKIYTFDKVDDDTYGVLSLTDEEGSEETDFDVNNEPLSVEALEIVKEPVKTEYIYKLESIDLTGIEIKITYSDGSKRIVSDENCIKLKAYKFTKRGTGSITVECEGAEISYNVTVKYTWWQWIIIILLGGWIWY